MKTRTLVLLLLAEVAAMSLWFVSAAVLPDMLRETTLTPFRQAALSSGVQAGFVIGALVSAVLGLADRFDPRRVFAASAIGAGLINLTLLIDAPGGAAAIAARVATGALLAGVYPVGMKIVVGWGEKDRGFLVGALIGALVLGTASPHLIALIGGADWRLTVAAASAASVVAGLISLGVALGPYHGVAARFDPHVVVTAWTNRRVRLAYAGYLGHMFELYAMWAWIGVASAVSYRAFMAAPQAEQLAKITAFCAIGIGGVASAIAGRWADRIGKAEVAIIAMVISGASALLAGSDLRRPGVAYLSRCSDLGRIDRAGFGAVLGAGRRCLTPAPGRQPADVPDRARLRADLRHRAADAGTGIEVRMAHGAGGLGARAGIRHRRHGPTARAARRTAMKLVVPRGLRTSDLRFRKPLLYPAELRDRWCAPYHNGQGRTAFPPALGTAAIMPRRRAFRAICRAGPAPCR